jgi:hypothetical protein
MSSAIAWKCEWMKMLRFAGNERHNLEKFVAAKPPAYSTLEE